MFGLANKTRSESELAAETRAKMPPPPTKPNPLEGHDVALYIDGNRITLTALMIEALDGARMFIYAETSLEAALNPDVNASESLAWGGFKPLDIIKIKDGSNPFGGVMQIKTIIMPAKAGEPARFRGMALTPIYNMATGDLIAKAEDECEVPVAWAVKQNMTASPYLP